MHKNIANKAILWGSIIGALGVMLSAFGAHALKNIVNSNVLNIFDTATKYQLYHSLLLILIGLISHVHIANTKFLAWSFKLIQIGLILFCGSLYLLCYILHNNLPYKWVGAITPLGGLSFILGWIFIGISVLNKTK